MDLHLRHYTPCKKEEAENDADYIMVRNLEDWPALDQHRSLIAELKEPDKFFTIYIFPNEQQRQLHESAAQDPYNVLLTGNIEDLQDEIARIEATHCLPVTERFSSRAEGTLPNGSVKVFHAMLHYPVSYLTVPVLYYKQIGYQYNGMRRDFCEDFVDCKYYYKKEDVIKAATYIAVPLQHMEDQINYFHSCFIHNFVEGASIFYPSW